MNIILSVILFVSLVGAAIPPFQKAGRLPMQKQEIKLEAPKRYAQRILRVDKNTGEPVYYDPKPQIMLMDRKSGKYAFKWIGYDGKEKVVIYQRPDAIDAVVSGAVMKADSGKFIYVYKVENLTSSRQEFATFVVQGFTTDVQPDRTSNIFVGPVTKNDREFKDGSWLGFAVLDSSVQPGRSIEFRLESSAPPGMVECRISGGPRGMKGVGEDMPQELENVLPGYEAWPRGFTIGPDDGLKSLPANKRINYIRKRLLHFQRLGWMATGSVSWYQENLRGDNLEAVYRQAEEDLRAGRITTEVSALIESIQQ
jgi:hypothetical protein